MVGRASPLEPKFLAALDLIRRTGAQSVAVRYSDDNEPVIWMVVAEHFVDRRGLPTSGKSEPVKKVHHTVGAGLNVLRAAMVCAESMIDGGVCAHCAKPTAFDTDGDLPLNAIPWACVIRYDPFTDRFNNDCGGRADQPPAPTDPRGFDVT